MTSVHYQLTHSLLNTHTHTQIEKYRGEVPCMGTHIPFAPPLVFYNFFVHFSYFLVSFDCRLPIKLLKMAQSIKPTIIINKIITIIFQTCFTLEHGIILNQQSHHQVLPWTKGTCFHVEQGRLQSTKQNSLLKSPVDYCMCTFSGHSDYYKCLVPCGLCMWDKRQLALRGHVTLNHIAQHIVWRGKNN